ncbi:hypothetical protein [Burkholderia sp. Ac-20353]|uniref:hypothetical protein n=1 Tax=Burkholderia sp. Ac-20353 TaxID=2703894 RepID=UPI00197C25CF|nr:hypothetical protein [Burkholderia sp. Ac-20353]MBN3788312.1 hypothetical protein [Burkholderia sp. Ac-20353]
MEAILAGQRSAAIPLADLLGCPIETSKPTSGVTNLRSNAGDLALLSTRFGTRIVQVKGRAADLCYDWKVEVLGSPIWCVDARSDLPALTNLGLVKDKQLFPLETGVTELSLA